MSRIDKQANKLERLAYSALAIHKLSELEGRINELEDALEASGWVYFKTKYTGDRIKEEKGGLKQGGERSAGEVGSGGAAGKGSGEED
jgi:hypothetical protein